MVESLSLPEALDLIRYWNGHPPTHELLAWAYGWKEAEPIKQAVKSSGPPSIEAMQALVNQVNRSYQR